ncbi:actin-related protein 6-like [Paramacrobiotus metropolitanus]|uniref:actin-related protein 6-like n=1 Tax=Paramacrobiotus metropolitanus TaxID=2943436 RepID=UPI002445D6FB|nr:actin-related protein 6-like [Paramacrobiotus metropolitanus]
MPIPQRRTMSTSSAAAAASSSAPSRATNTVVLDLGGYTAKIGLASDAEPRVLPNCIYKAKSEKKRQFISNQISECKDQHQLFHMYPFNNGFLTNWELEERVLDYFFGSEVLNIDTTQTKLLITEPYFNFQTLKRYFAEAIFEDYGFEAAFICPPAHLAAFQFRRDNPQEPTCLVVDSGHSFTHIVPVIDGRISWDSVIRVPVGGKILTNHLKQRITFQQLNVMDETHVINHLKELTCFVSTDLTRDFQRARDAFDQPETGAARTFVLPDYNAIFEGFLKPVEQTFDRPGEHEQSIRLTADRFVVPEILFRPSAVGDTRMGVGEAAVEAIRRAPEDKRLYLFRNMVLTGGNCRLPGFRERFMQEVAPEVPEFGEAELMPVKDPIAAAWFGGKSMVESGVYDKLCVTKAEYMEHGENVCERKFVRSCPKRRSNGN